VTRTPAEMAACELRRAALPLAAYYAITLALPLANGAGQAGAPFVDHAVTVLIVPLVVIVLAGVVRRIPRFFVWVRRRVGGGDDFGWLRRSN
jgi:hypothetical protein